ncbi:hypothetical protein L9F63_017344, partial [Diploptera punctata]
MASSTAVLSVQGMTCTSCTTTIESNISQLEGVEKLAVSLEKGEVYITFQQQSRISPWMIAEKISDMGFEASVKHSSESQDMVLYFKGVTKSKTEIDTLKEKLAEMKGLEDVVISPAFDAVTLTLKGLSSEVIRSM